MLVSISRVVTLVHSLYCCLKCVWPLKKEPHAKARTFLPVHIGGKEKNQNKKGGSATEHKHTAYETRTSMEELQKLSVVNKLCVELTNHLGFADKTLGEFIYSLAYDKEGTLVEADVFSARLEHNGADSFSPELVEALFNAISAMSSGTEVNFCLHFCFLMLALMNKQPLRLDL